MHIQPNSAQLRRYIPTETYFELQQKQNGLSLTGSPLHEIEEEKISARIAELESLEKTGFVYLGEKNWLREYLNSGSSEELRYYSHWVIKIFREYLQLKFSLSSEYDHLKYDVWQAGMDAEALQLGFEALNNPTFLPIDELEVFVFGDKDAPSSAHMVKAFEFLHNLEYSVSTVNYRTKVKGELSVTGIDVINPSDLSNWELNVISGYGADWDFTMIDGIWKDAQH